MTSKAGLPQSSARPEPPLGLRERKKRRTREAIRREAYRLFREQGYDATTIDQIADAAEVSASTFFRYFPTKEDVVLTDEYDPMIVQALRDVPPGTPVVETVRQAVVGPLRGMMDAGRAEMKLRMRLTVAEPAVQARSYHQQRETMRMMAEVFAERSGRDPGDPEPRYAAAAVVGVLNESMLLWAESGFTREPIDVVDEALRFLGDGLSAL
ncbi:TetR family transcriptional regulator [Yinghuangia sp. YIM S09857]|uniref:acyl-CoA-like ligand-binding transcription factor n=1 Tax=Yinghuangia sp. YIM S09857 TaxID=3436929 RepID=UPI003F538FFB